MVQVELLPDTATAAALWETLKLATRPPGTPPAARTTGVTGKTALQRLVYGELKAMGLSAQPTIHCVRKVAGPTPRWPRT